MRSTTDNLQSVVDGIRSDLARGFGGLWRLEHPMLREPMVLDVMPDGVTWLVRLDCGGRVVFDGAVDPEAFVSELYLLLRWAIRKLTMPAPRPS